jgi:APA family basic amino acid/polyamine antiporter
VLGVWDVVAVTAGTIMGSAIFIAAAFVPRMVPHPGLVILIWVVGGLITVAGALTYAELGTMFPEAGGQYHYLKEAFGPLSGFLFGWISLLAIQSGGVAYLGVAFGEYLGAFIPWFAPGHLLGTFDILGWRWQPNTAQLAGVAAILGLSAINYVGVRQGALTQGILTAIKVGSLLGLIAIGLAVPAKADPAWTAPVMLTGGLATALGLALVTVFGSFDGWYQATLLSGELRNPSRDLPRGMVGGTVLMLALYLLVNWVYFRAMPIADAGNASRIGEQAATSLLGAGAGRVMAGAVLISVFGSMSATLLGAARIGLPMAQDGAFFARFGRVHPRYQTPTSSIVFLAVWSSLLTLSGSYEAIFNYTTFAALVFHVGTGLAVFRLRRRRPDAVRPYRTWGYPWVPAVFVVATLGVVINTMIERPIESLIGLSFIAAGVVAFWLFRRSSAAARRG